MNREEEKREQLRSSLSLLSIEGMMMLLLLMVLMLTIGEC